MHACAKSYPLKLSQKPSLSFCPLKSTIKISNSGARVKRKLYQLKVINMINSALKQMSLNITLAIGLACLTLSHAKAEESIPSLLGTWDGENKTISEKKGYKTKKKTIYITEQKDRRFKGHVMYSGRKVNFFGVVYPDNISFTWVSKGSRGFNHGRILSKEKISACFLEAGIDATAGCAILKKAQ